MTGRIHTNRDLYCELTAVLERRTDSGRSLESYLSRLQELIADFQGAPISADAFAAMLDAAFVGPAPATNIEGLRRVASNEAMPAWHRQLAQQIVDLREMAEVGTLDDPQRYFGVDAPSGARWFNFDPHTFIECGLAGSLGGWAPGDDTGREYVPGQVAALDEDGVMVVLEPQELDEPVVSMPTISYDALADFFWAGQYYE